MTRANEIKHDTDTTFDALVCRISAALEASEDVSLSSYLEAYPRYAEQLTNLFPTLQAMAELGKSGASKTSTDGSLLADEAPPKVLGDFEIIEEIGRGGMGVVYQARQMSLQRIVALKVLPFAAVLDQKQLRRFRDEAQIAARLRHPNIIPVFAVGCERGVHFYAMQLVEGRTLADLILEQAERSGTARFSRPNKSSSSRRAAGHYERIARLGIEVADALHYAHEEGVIHRDIKPSNLMLDDEGKVWIADFGLARFNANSSRTMTGDIVGTLRYMSPEQAHGETFVDRRADVYSLGATLYELLTSRPVFAASNQPQLLSQITSREPVRLRRIDASIPRDLEMIILRAIQKDAFDRYESAQLLADDLRRFVAHQPVKAARPNPIRWLTKWSRRHRTLVATAVTCLAAALMVFAVGSMSAVRRINALHQQAQHERSAAKRQSRALLIQQANQMLDGHDPVGAIEPLASALELASNPVDDAIDRIRLGTTWRAAPRLLQVFSGGRYPRCAAMNADGNYVALVYEPDVALICTTWTRAPVARISQTGITHLEFSPVGMRLLITGEDGVARIWEAATGQPVNSPVRHSDPLYHGTFSRDGQRIVTADTAGNVKVWLAASGEPVGPAFRHRSPHTGAVVARFSPAADRVVTATQFDGVRVWDVATGAEVFARLTHDKFVTDACFSADGQSIWTAASDGWLRRWDLALDRTDVGFGTAPERRYESTRLVFDPSGQFVLGTRSLHGRAVLCDVRTSKQLAAFGNDTSAANFVAFAPNGHRFLIAHDNGDVRVWEMAHGQQLAQSWQPSDEVYDLAWDGNRYVCLADGPGNSIAVYTRSEDKPLELPCASGNRAVLPRLHPAGEAVAVVREDRLQLLSLTGRVRAERQLEEAVHGISFSPGGDRLVVVLRGEGGGHLLVFGSLTLQKESELQLPVDISTAAVDNTGTYVAAIDARGEAKVWELSSAEEVMSLPHKGSISSLAFDEPGHRIVSASRDGSARVWDIVRREAVTPPLRHSAPLAHATFGPQGHVVATAGSDGVARLWSARTGEPASAPLDNAFPPRKGHGPPLRKVYLRPDGRQLASVPANGMLRFWDLTPIHHTVAELHHLSIALTGYPSWPQARSPAEARESLEEVFDRLARDNPTDFRISPRDATDWRLRQATNAALMSNWEAAAQQYDKLIDLDQSRVDVWHLRAQAHLSLQAWESAADDFQQAIQRGMDDGDTRDRRGWCLAMFEATTLVPAGSVWRWLHPTDGVDPAVGDADFHETFAMLGFDDSQWMEGRDRIGPQGGFGYGDDVGIHIGLPAQGNRKTAYFRHRFRTNLDYDQLVLLLQRDDGVVVYLDGEEVVRDNVAQGPDRFDLLASSNPAYEEQSVIRHLIDRKFSRGRHVLAISLHNKSPWSSDLRLAQVSLHGLQADGQSSELTDAMALVDRANAFREMGAEQRATVDLQAAARLSGGRQRPEDSVREADDSSR